MIQMQGVDLAQFRFDYDLTFAVMFLHADGTVLGRYGSGGEDVMAHNSLDGLRKAMERALALHDDFDDVEDALAAKRGGAPEYPVAEDYPVANMRRRKGRTDSKSCIHCHMIHEAEVELAARKAGYDPLRFTERYPPPENVGLHLDVDDGLLVTSVDAESAAARAGISAGDRITHMAGQPLTSIADVQWVLQGTPATARVPVVLGRGGEAVDATLVLSGDWKRSSVAWRTSMFLMPPAPGLHVVLVEGRKKLALRVGGVYKPAVRKSLKKGDLIVRVDGKNDPMTAREFHEYLRLNHYEKGSKLELQVRRKGKLTPVTVSF